MSTALWSAPGDACKKHTISFWDSVSACTASAWIFKYSDVKNKHLIKSLFLLYPLFHCYVVIVVSDLSWPKPPPYYTRLQFGKSSFGIILLWNSISLVANMFLMLPHNLTYQRNLWPMLPIPFYLTFVQTCDPGVLLLLHVVGGPLMFPISAVVLSYTLAIPLLLLYPL